MPSALKADVTDALSSLRDLAGNLDPCAERDPVATERIPSLLAVSPYEEDHAFLRQVSSRTHWKVHSAYSCRDAMATLRAHSISVVIWECDVPDGTWRDLLREAERTVHRPALIVTSRLADECLWAEVLNLGGYDVLMKPFDSTEVVRVVGLAWVHWKGLRNNPAEGERG